MGCVYMIRYIYNYIYMYIICNIIIYHDMKYIEYAQQMKLCDIYAALCLVGRLGKDFQTANVLGCTWCGGPSWLLGISFQHQFRHGSSTCGNQLPEGIWGLFRISQAVPHALTEDSWQAIFMFFLMLGVHREL